MQTPFQKWGKILINFSCFFNSWSHVLRTKFHNFNEIFSSFFTWKSRKKQQKSACLKKWRKNTVFCTFFKAEPVRNSWFWAKKCYKTYKYRPILLIFTASFIQVNFCQNFRLTLPDKFLLRNWYYIDIPSSTKKTSVFGENRDFMYYVLDLTS